MINEIYLNEKHITSMKRIFKVNKQLPSIKLERFLDQKDFLSVVKKTTVAKYSKKVDPMHASYSISKNKILDFNSKEHLLFFSNIIGKKVRKIEGAVHCFSHKD